jgi:cell division protein FtsQ
MNEPLVDVTGARRERERRRLLLRLKLVGGVTGVLAVVSGLFWVVAASSLLAVREVNVQGVHLATVESVQDVAAIEIGTPLVRVDAPGAAQRIVTLPEVAEADVIRSWPNAITIVVKEREPRLAVPNGSRFNLVDATGVSFAEVPSVPKGVPLADVPASDLALLQAVAKVADLLPESVRSETRLLKAGGADSITLIMSSNRKIIWGGTENSELKARVLAPMMKTEARTYNVSAPTNPITRR